MAALTVKAMIAFLNAQLSEKGLPELPAKATEKEVSAAIATIAVKARAAAIPRFTRIVNEYGQVKFAKVQMVLASDELEPALEALQSIVADKVWLAENATKLNEHKVASKMRMDAHLARKAAKEKAAKEKAAKEKAAKKKS